LAAFSNWREHANVGELEVTVVRLVRARMKVRMGDGEEGDKKEKDHGTASGRRVDGAAGPDSSSYRSGERDST
jgi:hypothetical protein